MKILNKPTEKPQLEVGETYKIDGKLYLIDEVTMYKTYAWRLDENKEPYGRAIIIPSIKIPSAEKV